MNKIKYIILAFLLSLGAIFSACSNFMDITPTDQYTEEAIFSDAGLTQSFVNQLYLNIVHGAQEYSTTGISDDAYFTHNRGQVAVNEATVSESFLEFYDREQCPFRWKDRYKGIYRANTVIANIDQVPEKPGYDLKQMKGEAHFLRAYMYSELVRGYGGVPIVDKVYAIADIEEMKQPRNTMKECIEFIVKDLEIAEANLPKSVPDAQLGRAVSGAATALKARMLLHVASPLYADRTINTLAVNQYEGDRTALYRAAKVAALAVIESGDYELIDCRGGSNTERAEKFKSIITVNNKEQIFTKQFGLLLGSVRNSVGLFHGPNGYKNWSGTTPTHDLVQAFEFEDGTLPVGMTKAGDSQIGNPYNGREPRFYATVATDGNEWGRPRPAYSSGLDPTPLGRLQTGTYELSDGGVDVTMTLPDKSEVKFKGYYGLDTRNGPIESWNGSWTGYYEKKLIDTAIDAAQFKQEVPWTYIRLAEMYLVAAEASIELNELDDAVTYLDPLRNRIGNKDTKTALTARGKGFNQADLRDFVRWERRAELAFEESRYYDVRRWMIADVAGNKTITGIQIYGLLKDGQTQGIPYIHNEDKYVYHYHVIDLPREKRRWDNKMYFAPISRDEINRNPNLVQNPGME